MDEGYNDGQALFNLAQAYMQLGENENAITCFQMVVDNYGDSEYAAEAQTNLDTLNQAAADSGEDTSEDTAAAE